MLSLPDIEAAGHRIKRHLRTTPCVLSEILSEITACQVYLKFENLQRTGSFKERGALNRLIQLSDEERQKGVVTASAGNHGQAVAHHATRLGIEAAVVMPRHTPINKITSTRRLGGRLSFMARIIRRHCVMPSREPLRKEKHSSMALTTRR